MIATLRLGTLGDSKVGRSGIRWLCANGHHCRAREILAYCTITPPEGFVTDEADVQIALASPIAGRVEHDAGASRGGYLDRVPWAVWDAAFPWATIETHADANPLIDAELLFVAGRRPTPSAENRSGLLTGWYDRRRAWWGDGEDMALLGLGVCEMNAIFGGNAGWFGEMFEHAVSGGHIVQREGDPLVPSAAILLEQVNRTDGERDAIRADVAAYFHGPGRLAQPGDWLFVSSLLNALESSPLTERHSILSRSGVHQTSSPRTVCMSLGAELGHSIRHRRLGYRLNLHNFRFAEAGPAVKNWLRSEFEVSFHSVEDVARDYHALLEALPDRRFIVINRISTQAFENIQNYAGLDAQTLRSIATLRAKDLNLMLHDLARGRNLQIVDADEIAADLGMAAHLPDGVHGSGIFYDRLRDEVLRVAASADPELGGPG